MRPPRDDRNAIGPTMSEMSDATASRKKRKLTHKLTHEPAR
jgi:hypothetical protein